MVPTIGHVAVLAGLALSAYGAIVFVLAGRGGDPRLALSGRRAVIGSFAAAGIGCAAMVASLLSHDFSVLYVADNNALHRILNEWADIIPARFETYPLVELDAAKRTLAAQTAAKKHSP